MPIKFHCPHCKKLLSVKDHLAGKKGPCPNPACKKTITVPAPSSTPPPAPAAPQAAPAPPAPDPVDVEAEAAALLADKPEEAAPAEVKTIDFTCPYCDEPLHMPVEQAGKRAPCPECRRIIKVPELVKNEPLDWRRAAARGPSAARPQAGPAPEGAWASTDVGRVGAEALMAAGVIKERERPKTRLQKALPWALGAAGLAAVVVAGVFTYRWVVGDREKQALQFALGYADSDGARGKVGRQGQAALHRGAGEYYLRGNRDGSGAEARQHFEKALSLLREMPAGRRADERDPGLVELAASEVGLGGSQTEIDTGRRLKWDDTQKILAGTLTAVHDAEDRLEGVREVSRRLLDRGQTPRVLPLVAIVYASASAEDRAEALAAAGLELLRAGHRREAEVAAEQALALYGGEAKDRPVLKAPVVALAVALDKKPPEPGKGAKKNTVEDKENSLVGRAEGLARKGKLDEARKEARSAPHRTLKLRALVGVAAAAADTRAGTEDLNEAVKQASEEGETTGTSWVRLRLIRLAAASGQGGDKLQEVANTIPDPVLRGRGQLAVLEARLAGSKQVVEDAAADKVEDRTLARNLAREALARHNTRVDHGWAKAVDGWPEPQKAFGALGVALGLQKE